MLKKLFEKIKEKPGLFLLILILFFISIATVKPDFHLLGWDNYSTYFNLKTSIFRTFFATWRHYRGLGVPSDSEATDIFRQVFYLVVSPFAPQTILDQLYIVLSLITGVLVMYFFASYIAKKAKHTQIIHEHQDLLGFFSGLLYLFNLNTLAVFYFPMIMYINRFFTLPTLFFIFTYILYNEKISLKKYLFFAFTILFSSGSYITATVFITVLMAIGIFGVFQKNLKKVMILILFFLGLNLFWLLPFFNYTIQKSKIVQSAPTFIEANEAQLNKPKSFYSLGKQLILYPNFFDTELNNINLTKKLPYHPIVKTLNSFPQNLFFFIFPLLYLSGSMFILFLVKEKRNLLWIPVMIFVFLFLSQKEYSVLGILYSLLDKYVPYFGVFFRFGDTKFHSFIAFPGSIAGAIALLYILHFVNKAAKHTESVIKYFVIGIAIVSSVFVFKDYFNGRLLGFFMYSKIPQAYFDIASIINNDHGNFRVAHLPFDKDGYWKTYEWGMMGSAFFEFLMDKPFIDKTFEPASAENARLDEKMYGLIDNFQAASENNSHQQKADDFYRLMKQVGVKYLILDETVNPQMYPKGVTLWGKFNLADSKSLVKRLESMNLLTKISSYQVNIQEYMDLYEKVGELQNTDIENVKKNPFFTITLYTLNESDPEIGYMQKARPLDPTIQEGFDQNTHYVQSDSPALYETYPFRKKDLGIDMTGGKTTMELPNMVGTNLNYFAELPSVLHPGQKAQVQIEVYAKVINNALILSFYQLNAPSINGISNREKIKEISAPLAKVQKGLSVSNALRNYVSNWQILPYGQINNLRLQIGDTILPLPYGVGTAEKYAGSLVVSQGDMKISLLQQNEKEILVDPDELALTENPNCFGDALENYQFSHGKTRGKFTVSSQNGTTCFWKGLKQIMNGKSNHIEIALDVKGTNENLDNQYKETSVNSSKPVLKQVVQNLPKPNFIYICLKESSIDQCFNTHTKTDIEGEKKIVIAPDKRVTSDDLVLSFALSNLTYQKQTFAINRLGLSLFNPVLEDTITVTPRYGVLVRNISSPDKKIVVQFNTPLNYFSYYQNNTNDGYFLSNAACDRSKGYRTFRQMNGILVSYLENCDNTVSEPLRFGSNNLYLWLIQYNVASGKYPKFMLDDGFNSYVNKFVSLDQGYPNIKEFKTFQNPEFFADKNVTAQKLENLVYRNAYVWIPPQPEAGDERNKSFMVNQYSENEGLFAIKDFNVMQVPNTWNDLVLYPGNNNLDFGTPDNLEYQNILPSLWSLTVHSSSQEKNIELFFNEAYDRQWGVYKSIPDLLLGNKAEVSHTKCDGYANCFELKPETGSYYIFYWPEKLNFLGWFGVLAVLIIFRRCLKDGPCK